MNKLIPLLLIALVSCSAPKTNEFQIHGKIAGKTPNKVYLQVYENGSMQVLDSSTFTKGEFRFTGSVDFPDNYIIQLGQERNYINLFVENSKIKITAHIDSLDKAIITGSETQNQWLAYQKIKEPFENQLGEVYQLFKTETDATIKAELEQQYDSIDAAKNQRVKEWISATGASVLAPYIIRRELVYYLEMDELEELLNVISPELIQYKYTAELHERLETLRTLQPGKPAPEFTQNNPEGEPVNLSDFKGNYLLIDFWASWCGPCRRANPTVVAMHNKYKSKGFTILGVSMDKDREKWLQAIEDDKLHWSQVSDLGGWTNPVGKLYGVNSIPHAILIDPEGNIVKRGVHPNELDELLGSLLKK
ncbi:MAG: redoxin domain-containing protein [Salinivirgaceae bacterium]